MKRITEQEYNELKRADFAAIRSTSFAVGKEYTVAPPKGYKCNGVNPLNGEGIYIRCSQSQPTVIKKYDPIKKEYL